MLEYFRELFYGKHFPEAHPSRTFFKNDLRRGSADCERSRRTLCSRVRQNAGLLFRGQSSRVEFTAGAAAVYNRLVDFKPGTTQIEPSLAERWEISQDGREYTFYLRRGVKFHTTPWFQPTREFSAEDVLFTFNRMRDPNMPFRRADTTEFPYWHGTGLARLVEKIEALGADRMAVRFTLKEANAPFLHNLAVPFASIHSAEYAAQLLEKGKAPEINQKPVG